MYQPDANPILVSPAPTLYADAYVSRGIQYDPAPPDFAIERMVEPMPRPDLEAVDPGAFATTRPWFLFFVLRPMPEDGAWQHAQYVCYGDLVQ